MKCLLLPCLALSCLGLQSLANPTTQPAPAVTVDSILDRLEAEGRRINDLRCDIDWQIEDTRVFEKTVKRGSLMLIAEPNPVFRIDFTQLLDSDGTVRNRLEQHIFDGRWYTEARESTRTIVRREMARKGEKVDLFSIGSSHFLLPFKQKKQDILHHFTVTVEAGSDTTYLKCVPRSNSHLADDYSEIHFRIDRNLGLPVSIVLHQKKDGKVVTVSFKRVRINTALSRDLFKIDPPKGWHTVTEPLPKRST